MTIIPRTSFRFWMSRGPVGAFKGTPQTWVTVGSVTLQQARNSAWWQTGESQVRLPILKAVLMSVP